MANNSSGENFSDEKLSPTSSSTAPLSRRGRGRPSLGKPTPVVMDACEEIIAREMGGGVKSLGVRLALRAVHMLGVERAKELADFYVTRPVSEHCDTVLSVVPKMPSKPAPTTHSAHSKKGISQ